MAKWSGVAMLLLLAMQQTVAYRLTPTDAKESEIEDTERQPLVTATGKGQENGLRNSLAQADDSSERVLYCSSFCIPCADGKRSVLVSRERGMDKYVEGLLTTGAVVAGVAFTPWAFAALPALAGMKTYTDTLHDECPNMQLVYFDKDRNGGPPNVQKLDDHRLQGMLEKDEYLKLWKKNMDRLLIAEKATKESRDVNWAEDMFTFGANRSHGQLPEALVAYASNSELFCEDFGEGVVNVTEETFGEASSRVFGWQSFAKSCKEIVSPPPSRCCCQKADGDDTPQCELMFEDQLKKSINPTKWGELVCPSGRGYKHYERFGLTSLPESCASAQRRFIAGS